MLILKYTTCTPNKQTMFLSLSTIAFEEQFWLSPSINTFATTLSWPLVYILILIETYPTYLVSCILYHLIPRYTSLFSIHVWPRKMYNLEGLGHNINAMFYCGYCCWCCCYCCPSDHKWDEYLWPKKINTFKHRDGHLDTEMSLTQME